MPTARSCALTVVVAVVPQRGHLTPVLPLAGAFAARGDRVVGVVTHVPALAERVPVRFVVSRDQRGSSVARENL